MISDLQTGFDLTDKGDIEAFLGIKFKQNNHKITMLQPGLIYSIPKYINILDQEKVKTHDTSVTAPLLQKQDVGGSRQKHWYYRSSLGKLSYL